MNNAAWMRLVLIALGVLAIGLGYRVHQLETRVSEMQNMVGVVCTSLSWAEQTTNSAWLDLVAVQDRDYFMDSTSKSGRQIHDASDWSYDSMFHVRSGKSFACKGIPPQDIPPLTPASKPRFPGN